MLEQTLWSTNIYTLPYTHLDMHTHTLSHQLQLNVHSPFPALLPMRRSHWECDASNKTENHINHFWKLGHSYIFTLIVCISLYPLFISAIRYTVNRLTLKALMNIYQCPIKLFITALLWCILPIHVSKILHIVCLQSIWFVILVHCWHM